MNILAVLSATLKDANTVPDIVGPSIPANTSFRDLKESRMSSPTTTTTNLETSTPPMPPFPPRALPQKKRPRDSKDERPLSSPNAKKAKLVLFHPDTDDNGVWATGRKLVAHKGRRQPTPFVHADGTLAVSEFVEGFPGTEPRQPFIPASPTGDDEASSPRLNTRAHRRNRRTPIRDVRPGCGVIPSNVNGFATSIPYPRMSIVMTDENGATRAWEVTADIFEDVSVYLEVRSAGRTSLKAIPESRSICGTTPASNEKETTV